MFAVHNCRVYYYLFRVQGEFGAGFMFYFYEEKKAK